MPIEIGKINGSNYRIGILPKYANRHGLIAGATGTGKTVTLMTLVESFAYAGVPVFISDVKGDISGLASNDELSTTFWDIYGTKGKPVSVSLENVGSLMLSKILKLGETQSGVLTIAFKYAADTGKKIVNFKDLRAILNELVDNRAEMSVTYGLINTMTVGGIMRAMLVFSEQSGDDFFDNPSFDIMQMIKTDDNGRGLMNIMDATRLMLNPSLYGTFLMWMLTELFRLLPEMGDVSKPKFVFVFDEAHLLFRDASPMLMEKIEQVVRLIRSKGVGVYFCSQSPSDIPEVVLGQLGNKIQHALRAFTPNAQKMVRSCADTFVPNPNFNTLTELQALGTGEALVSFLSAKGIPQPVQKVKVNLPKCKLGEISDDVRERIIGSMATTPVEVVREPMVTPRAPLRASVFGSSVLGKSKTYVETETATVAPAIPHMYQRSPFMQSLHDLFFSRLDSNSKL